MLEAAAIWVRLDGGLGNQMFQYAFGCAISASSGRPLMLDASALAQPRGNVTPRSFALAPFKLRAAVYEDATVVRPQWFLSVARRFRWFGLLAGTVTEQGPAFDATVAAARAWYYAGYWQSPLYFDSVADQLLLDFQPRWALCESARSFIGALDHRSVMLHVRRGDYVSLATAAAHHGALEMAYYRRAIERCLVVCPHARFHVFSDDIAWCRTQPLFTDLDVAFVENDPGRADWQDLMMMAACTHHVIANSSFSWWAAWLRDRCPVGGFDRLVVAPRRWFANDMTEPADRFPCHWEVL